MLRSNPCSYLYKVATNCIITVLSLYTFTHMHFDVVLAHISKIVHK